MKRIRLIIAYDGTDYKGWAEQRNQRTVCGTLKECICQVSGEEVELRGASRTDSGAHAVGQVADFETQNPMPATQWAYALNRKLGRDVMIIRASQAPNEFHSRFYARSRTYEYRVSEAGKMAPTRARYVHAVGTALDVKMMREAAKRLLGKRDFRAFGEQLESVENCTREMLRSQVLREGDEIVLRFEATAFIRGMVRRLSGALVEVGRGKRSVASIEALFDKRRRDREQWPVVLPACGLSLVKVHYGKRLRDLRSEPLPGEWD